jgi:integrase
MKLQDKQQSRRQRTLTLGEAVEVATEYWRGRPGERSMGLFATRCITLLGEATALDNLGPATGVTLLGKLRQEGLSAKTIGTYYGAFRRLLTLNGVSTMGWPKAPPPQKRTREAIGVSDLEALISWLRRKGWDDTADLAVLIRGTGLRIAREALNGAALMVTSKEAGYDSLKVTGKGGHERVIPVVDLEARAILRDRARLLVVRSVPYNTHLRRWKEGTAALGITSKLPTPHSVRHQYACEALRKSGGNLIMVQELLGHSNPNTTALYLTVTMGDKAKALALA